MPEMVLHFLKVVEGTSAARQLVPGVLSTHGNNSLLHTVDRTPHAHTPCTFPYTPWRAKYA